MSQKASWHTEARAMGEQINLHNYVLGVTCPIGSGFQCDHINRDKLDNRRGNLRVVTVKENQANRGGLFAAKVAA